MAMFLSTWYLLLLNLLCGLIAAEDSFSFPVHRDVAEEGTIEALAHARGKHHKQHTGSFNTMLGKSLYWFGNFSVGDSPNLKLLLDTGSSDLLINPGLYKPSKHEKPYKKKRFSITYEGVNRAGFGFETVNGTCHRDIVSSGGLTVVDQPLGNTTSFKYFDVKHPLPYPQQGQGIIGFEGGGASSFGARSWFYNLCDQKIIPECKLGLAFGTSGKGSISIGKVARRLVKGKFVELPNVSKPGHGYNVRGDVTLDDKIVVKNQTLIMDCGTDNIQGPLKETKKILDLLGYQTVLKVSGKNFFYPGSKVKVLDGFFECDKPPTLGFSFPAEADLKPGEKARIFNVSPKVWDVYKHGNNNCTSILGGTNGLTDPKTGYTAWLLGQPFFAGHYLDFDIRHHTVGFADLKDSSMGGYSD